MLRYNRDKGKKTGFGVTKSSYVLSLKDLIILESLGDSLWTSVFSLIT
jgi:hypothetical protein